MTSVLNVDTIAAKDGTSAATLTKQEASKFWVSMDTVNNAIEGSLNASSYTDEATGEGTISKTNAFSSQHDRCILLGLYNSSTDGTGSISGASRAFTNINVGASSSSDIDPLSAGSIQFATAYGSTAGSDGGATDVSKAWLSAIGDLA